MNKELWNAYHGLNKMGKEALAATYAQSPVMTKLVQLLDEKPESALQTHVLVEHIYGISLRDADFAAYRNRYYKLRKKMLADIREMAQGSGTEFPEMTQDEQEFFRARKMMANNDYRNAKTVLDKLYQRCLKLNLFELMPGVVDELAVCAGIFNEKMEARSHWVGEFHRVTALLADFHKMRGINKEISIYSQSAKTNDKVIEALGQMRRIMEKHPQQPRFAIVYYFAAANYATVAYGKRLHSVRRLLNRLQELCEQYPEVPYATAEPGHEIRLRFFRIQMEMIYYWQKRDYEKAYQYLCEYWDGASGPFQRFVQLSENGFRNKANLEIRTKRFEQAEETIFSFLKFLKENGMHDKTPSGWCLLTFVYVRAWPKLQPDNPDFMLRKMDELLGSGGHPIVLRDAVCIKTDFLYVLGRYKEAMANFSHEFSQEYFKMIELPEAAEFYALPLETDASEKHKKRLDLLARLKKRLTEKSGEDFQEVVNWYVSMLSADK